MENKSKKVTKYIIAGICLAFIVLVCLRKFVFDGTTLFYNLFEEDYATNTFVRLLKTAFLFAIAVVVGRVSEFVISISEKVKDNTAKTATLLIASVLKYAAAIAVVLVGLGVWGVDTTAIVTGAGVITLIIGLGCQTLVSDIVSGIFMLFEGDIKVGDIVVIDGWRGTVKQIGLRRTKIEDTVGNVNIVNNSSISNIINNTQQLSVAIIDVGTEYNESIIRIEEVLEKGLPEIKKNVPAIVDGPYYKGVSSLGESCVNIRLVANCKEEDKYQVERDINREIKILFDKNDISIPFNQIVLNTRDPNEPNKTQYVGHKASNDAFRAEQAELSKGIEEQDN